MPEPPSDRTVVSLPLETDTLQRFRTLPPELENLVARRLGGPWRLFVYEAEGTPVAWSFLHLPEQKEWLDSVPTLPGECRETSTFVMPEQRGKGLRAKLLEAQSAFCTDMGLRRHWAIVEKRNGASISSSLRAGGRIAAKSLVIKMLGRNIVEVRITPNGNPRPSILFRRRREVR
ncbi:N-acetyltransferase family protein [Dietzia sp. ANT_WB102]|uniref:GNAT family N-acetyltransferase n=1 Tax=Dietzia sp. ANT_WB102 TaxID=2597345 RepID=UPI00351A6F35